VAGATLHLFDGPYLTIGGRRREVPDGGQRLLAFVALSGPRVNRRAAAGTLWPVGSDERGAGNLRSALWRLRGAGIDVIESDKRALGLVAGIAVDLHTAWERATRVIRGTAIGRDLDPDLWNRPGELLPGWYEEWVVFERERWRQRLLHGLEALARHLTSTRRHADAVEVAHSVVALDPLRESAQRVLVAAHLAEGNVAEARRSFERYRTLLAEELQVRPGSELTALVHVGCRVGAVPTT
jgi:DNA-binding SARP family transcriptional activator